MVITIANPRHLQANRGYSLPVQEVLDWLHDHCSDHWDLSPHSSGCDIDFSDEVEAALFKLTWWLPPKDDV